VELTGKAHSAEREGVCGATTRRLAERAHEEEREKGCAGGGGATSTDKLAPLARERGEARGAETAAHLSSGAGARPGWAELGRLGCFAFFFFSGFSNCFSISFL
jgi:hypothetical protein